jgi:outer membrane protein OmpA-like peptidoglycan-associated protein
LVSLVLGTVATVAPSLAHAQTADNLTNGDTGADTHLFRPPVDSKGFIGTNGADIVGHLDYSLGLFLDYGYGIMPVTEGTQAEDDGSFLLDHSFQGTLQFNLGLANFMVIGLSAPVVLAGHDALNDIGPTGQTYSVSNAFAQGLGWIAAHAKFRILRVEDSPSVGLAAIVQGGVGVAGTKDLIGENGGFVWPQVVFEGRAAPGGIFRVGVNAGFRANFGGTPAVFGNNSNGIPVLESGQFEYGQLVTANLATSIRVVDPLDLVAETYSTFLVTGENDTDQRISAEALGGLKVFIDGKSFLYLGGGAGYAPGFQTATARGTLGFVFEPSIGDRDGDGFKDDEDDCPDQPEDKDGFEDTRDEAPEGQLGCPDPDNDKDGIPDVDDACPNDPEDKDGNEDQDGCPEEEPKGPVIIQGNEILIFEKVQFATGSAKILPASDSILDAVSKTLKEHPEFTLVEVQGHADSRADDKYNLNLTKQRAKAVMDALVKRGVEASRIRSMGFGEYCPQDPEENEKAWETNRRVEFKIVRTKDGPTDVVLGCDAAAAKGVKSPPP